MCFSYVLITGWIQVFVNFLSKVMKQIPLVRSKIWNLKWMDDEQLNGEQMDGWMMNQWMDKLKDGWIDVE